jgi:Zn-dependent membrane protease YugP
MIVDWGDPLAALLLLTYHFLPALLPLAPSLALAFWARRRVAAAARPTTEAPVDGAGLVTALLAAGGVSGVTAVAVSGPLAPFYDPSRHEVRLPPAVYSGRTPWALGLAAREAGHAMQHARRYLPLGLRTALVPALWLGSRVAWMTCLAGLVMLSPPLCLGGAWLHLAAVVSLWVLGAMDRDAGRRVLTLLPVTPLGAAGPAGYDPVRRAVDAASWSDLAATLPLPWSA